MGVIAEINRIADNRERAKEITSRVIRKGDKEDRIFGDVLMEELAKEMSLDKFDDNWTIKNATKDTGK
ncbi:MAG: hypothetical protein E7208_03845 [Clostridium butyricum]|nr:hypothetical protein [Clostridium butyricum]